jgi:ParB family chromosome partitioning protein
MSESLFSHASQEWYTPGYILDAARMLLQGIDLDPASCEEANKTVQAKCFFTREDDGLSRKWHGRVFLNPPGPVKGDKSTKGIVNRFWEKLVEEWIDDRVTEAVFVCFSIEQLQTLQNTLRSPFNFYICVPKRRIAFEGAGTSPCHGNAIIWLPGDGSSHEDRFVKAFGKIGGCMKPIWE